MIGRNFIGKTAENTRIKKFHLKIPYCYREIQKVISLSHDVNDHVYSK